MSSPVIVNGGVNGRVNGGLAPPSGPFRRDRRPTICPETCLIDPNYEPKHLRQRLRDFDLRSLSLDGEPTENTSRVLVLYTGGTIGMKTNDDGGGCGVEGGACVYVCVCVRV